jgi:F0F1-type ATP synthase assembly protein I
MTDIYANLRLAAWREALNVLAIQAATILVVAVVSLVGWGKLVGLGALIGGAIGLLANAYLAIALLGKPLLRGRAGDVRVGWTIKVVLTLSLLWIAMRAKIVPPPSLVVGYVGTIVAHWLAGMFWLRDRR